MLNLSAELPPHTHPRRQAGHPGKMLSRQEHFFHARHLKALKWLRNNVVVKNNCCCQKRQSRQEGVEVIFQATPEKWKWVPVRKWQCSSVTGDTRRHSCQVLGRVKLHRPTDCRIPVSWPHRQRKEGINMWNCAWFADSFPTLWFKPTTLCYRGHCQLELVE